VGLGLGLRVVMARSKALPYGTCSAHRGLCSGQAYKQEGRSCLIFYSRRKAIMRGRHKVREETRLMGASLFPSSTVT